tara:strand:+ start:8390 stop:8698 length:309 start_codon:yes stop_codon:yes gene_type:complete
MNKQFENDEHDTAVIAAGWGNADLRHLSAETFANIGVPNVVYIREVRADELESELASQIDVPADTVLYAVHAANGQRMAVLDDRATAFAGARQYELEPVSRH